MVRVFRRVLARLRWPMAAIAAVLIGLMIAGRWAFITVMVPLTKGCPQVGLSVYGGGISFRWGRWFGTGFTFIAFGIEEPGWNKIAEWPAYGYQGGNAHNVDAPLWVVAVVPAALSWLGFSIARKRPRRGECPRCRYPLTDGARCPECGFQIGSSSDAAG